MELSHRRSTIDERFTFSSNVILPASEYNYETGALQPDFYSLRRTQADRIRLSELKAKKEREAAAKAKEKSRKGIRIPFKWGVLILLAVFLFFSIVLLKMVSTNGRLTDEVERYTKSNDEYRVIVEEKRAQLHEETSQGRICYQASQRLHMVPADQTSVMKLHVGEVTTIVQISEGANAFLSSSQPDALLSQR